MSDSMGELVSAVAGGRPADVRAILARSPGLKQQLNDPRPELPFDATLLLSAIYDKNRELVDVLLENGADINRPSGWWAGGFHALHGCDPALAPFLIERGAVVDAHAAARLGMMDRLQALLAENPALVHARGGDGQTPLHFAASVDVARHLLDRGAGIDTIDVDHESTPAQWMVQDRVDVARYLVSRGAKTDILMTAALGDLDRTREHLDRDPASVQTSVSERYFPKRNPHSGGCIYIWTIGGHKTAHIVARERGHDAIVELVTSRSPAALRLAVACQVGDDEAARAVLAETPGVIAALSADERERLAQAAEGNKRDVVGRLLAAGWPVNDRGPFGGTAVHWAAWHGNHGMVQDLLARGPDLELKDTQYGGTPLGWALHGSLNSWHRPSGDYGATVESLLTAGAAAPEITPELDASEPAIAALRRHRDRTAR